MLLRRLHVGDFLWVAREKDPPTGGRGQRVGVAKGWPHPRAGCGTWTGWGNLMGVVITNGCGQLLIMSCVGVAM